MLNILRKNAQSVVVQVIVFIIAIVFIFFGVGPNMGDNPNALAVVNGKEIPFSDFQRNYEQLIEQYKQQFGGQVPQGFLEKIGLKEQVLNQLIQAELLRQGAETIGIRISKEAIQDTIKKMEVFDTNGHFDLANYKAVLEQNRLAPASFEEGVRNDLLTDRMFSIFGDFSIVPSQEILNWIEYIDQEIKLMYAVVATEDYEADIKATDEALAAWYETTKQNYKTVPQRKLHYLSFIYAEDLKQVLVSDEAVRTSYQENIETYSSPETRRARHILFKITPEDSPETKEAKKAEAGKVLAQIKKGGDFVLLAGQFSEDVTSSRGGDLGFFGRGQMVQPFEDSVFSLKKGELSGVVETPFGYHIIQLEEIVPATTQSFDEVSAAIRGVLERQGVQAITFKKASTAYEDIIRAGSLVYYSSTEGASPVHQSEFFSRDTPPEEEMAGGPAFVQAAFALRKGELSSIVETASGYAILFVDDIKESVVPELAAVRERAVADYQKQKGLEMARSVAENLLQAAKEKQSWPADLQPMETDYIKRTSSLGALPAELLHDAFSQVGKEVFPQKVIAIGTDFYVYQITDVRQGKDEMESDERLAREQQLLNSGKTALMDEWLNQLRGEASISKNTRMLQ